MNFILTIVAVIIGGFISQWLYETYWDSKYPVESKIFELKPSKEELEMLDKIIKGDKRNDK